MSFDIRPLQHALGALNFTLPLQEGAPTYVERSDGLGQRILDHIMVPTTHRILLAGPAGCGKSTELLQLHRRAHPKYAVFVCPCDRDLDLYRFDPVVLVQYLMWRMVVVANEDGFKLTDQIRHEVLESLQLQKNQKIPQVRAYFSWLRDSRERPLAVDQATVTATFSRLVSEVERVFSLPVLLLIDGLEKLRPTAPTDALGDFLRSPVLDQCQSVVVVPSWTLYGWDSMERYPDTEVVKVPVSASSTFVRDVVARRVSQVFQPGALNLVDDYSGGVVRDGLQLASIACRRAMDGRSSSKVTGAHVDLARSALRQSFESMISDDPHGVEIFLEHVRRTGQLPGAPDLRNRLLGNGIVLPNEDGTFRVHPCAP